jgi:hypothetical protein
MDIDRRMLDAAAWRDGPLHHFDNELFSEVAKFATNYLEEGEVEVAELFSNQFDYSVGGPPTDPHLSGLWPQLLPNFAPLEFKQKGSREIMKLRWVCIGVCKIVRDALCSLELASTNERIEKRVPSLVRRASDLGWNGQDCCARLSNIRIDRRRDVSSKEVVLFAIGERFRELNRL